MIKFLGKIRYHWQPELSWSITYWSITIACVFFSLAVLYEQTSIPAYFFTLFTLFVVLVGLGFHRYFLIEKDKLKVICLSPFKKRNVLISSIERIDVTKSSITILTREGQKHFYYMRKLPKHYFLDAIAVHPKFGGEINVSSEIIDLDYFLNH